MSDTAITRPAIFDPKDEASIAKHQADLLRALEEIKKELQDIKKRLDAGGL